MAKQLSDPQKPHGWLFYCLNHKIQQDLLGIIQQLNQMKSPSALHLSRTLSHFSSSFAIVYQNFLQEWSWFTSPGRCHILRAISPERRKQLCHDLVDASFRLYRFDHDVKWTKSTTWCFYHIFTIATRHITCSEAILGILTEQLRDSDKDTHKQASGLKQALTAALSSCQNMPHIAAGHCLHHPKPSTRGDWIVFDPQPGRIPSLKLWFDHHYCSWVDAEVLSSWSPAELPLVVEQNGLRRKWICCRELRKYNNSSFFLGIKPFFVFSNELHVPKLVASITKGPIYVLVGRNRPDGSRPFLWEEYVQAELQEIWDARFRREIFREGDGI
ncbi:hypothetical protein JAAARDRAFT_480872 [Jaapia argillacea MUCL 33604]|uniref:Uncharacterized protein n=1 Tax=Jaapia argillacea MUCL 33604 TaxID=933084 RepID=A0A067PQL5_9AGAM|nr:hypothetical protein JAAARDRAFT_480872 [Jaapia argillacea MUCL 33604]